MLQVHLKTWVCLLVMNAAWKYMFVHFDGYFIFMEILKHSVKHLTPKTNKHRASKMAFQNGLPKAFEAYLLWCRKPM